MADVKKVAEDKAQSDHNYGQSAPTISDSSARQAYESQRAWLKQQEDAKKNT
jgi:hypothetical protein